MKRRVLVIAVLILTASSLFAQVPTPEEFLGYRIGDRVVRPARVAVADPESE